MINQPNSISQSPKELFNIKEKEKGKKGKRDNSLYLQFSRQLREMILNGRIRENTKLWPPRQISEELGLSRNTVLNAYKRLYDDRLIVHREHQGYFVTDIRFSKLSARGTRLSKAAENISIPSQPIPFATSLPDVIDTETHRHWKKIVYRVWNNTFRPPKTDEERKKKRQILGYSDPKGLKPLRNAISAYLNKFRGVDCNGDQLIITTGAQQCFSLIAWLVLDVGDWVWYEQPGYLGARYGMEIAGANLQPVPVGDDGLDIDAAIATGCKPRLIYTTPSCQYPTGVIMPLARRIELLEYAHANKALIIEDDYAPYQYVGEVGDSIQKLERMRFGVERTFYVGSFSKTIFPGLRLGYMIVPEDLLDTFVKTKVAMEIHHSIIGQGSLYHYISKGFSDHIEQMQIIYRQRQTTLVEKIQEKLQQYLEFKSLEIIQKKGVQYKLAAKSGNALVAYATEFAIKSGFDDKAFAKHVVSEKHGDEKVQVRSLSSFYIDPSAAEQGLVLGFAGFDDDEIIEGISRLEKHFNSYFKSKETSVVTL